LQIGDRGRVASVRLASAWVEQQCRCHGTAFAHQHVVGSASCGEIHDFKADSGFHEGAEQVWCGETLPLSGTDQHDLAAEFAQAGNVFGAELFETVSGPAGVDLGVGDDQVAVVADLVDHQVVGAVAGDDVGAAGLVEMKLHAGFWREGQG